jgi:high-affinity nickel-transport protein
VKPIRKLYYNMTITLVSLLVALVVGGIEALTLFAGRFHFSGMFWDTVRKVNDNWNARVLDHRVVCVELDLIDCLL